MRRPLNFMIVVWGREFCGYFLKFCVKSLLADGNIPTLCNKGDTFLIATTVDDFYWMSAQPEMIELQKHVTIECVTIQRPEIGVPPVIHSNKCLLTLLDRVYEKRSYGVMLSPDVIFSRGLGEVIDRAIKDQIGLLLLPTIRLCEGQFFSALAGAGFGMETMSTRSSIEIPAPTLARAAIDSLHPEILAGEWDSAYFGDYVNSVWWRVGHNDGILLHTFSFIPLLIDYSLVTRHDTSEAAVSNTDGPYLARNFPTDTRLRIVEDAQTVFIASWAPRERTAEGIMRPKWLFYLPGIGDRLRGAFLRQRFNYYVNESRDWIKEQIFCRPIAWRLNGTDDEWNGARERARLAVEYSLPGAGVDLLSQLFDRILRPYQRLRARSLSMISYGGVVLAALQGHEIARSRIKRRLKTLLQRVSQQ